VVPEAQGHLAVPGTLGGDVIYLEGHQLRIIPAVFEQGQGASS